MEKSEFKKVTMQFTKDRHTLMFTRKQKEYTRGDENAHSNFNRRADHLFTSPAQVLLVDMFKHLDVIQQWAEGDKGEFDAENLTEHFTDLANYVDLLYGMAHEGCDEE